VVGDIALVVTAIGVLGAVFGLRQSYRERLQQFEAMYVGRYWAIQDRMSLDALKGSDPKIISHADEQAIRAYLLLCEDELEMRQAGYIGDGTYILWAAGIRQQLTQPMFARIWHQIQNETTFPYDHLRPSQGPRTTTRLRPVRAIHLAATPPWPAWNSRGVSRKR
jgi:hypothetical protein